jgi:hypothetical protein
LKSKQNEHEYADKLECLSELQLLENQGHIQLHYGDEAGFSLNCVIPYCWQFEGEGVEILPQKGKTINTFGIMNNAGDELFTRSKQGTIKTEFVIDAIDEFSLTLKMLTVLVIDNARIHHSKDFKECLDKWEQRGLFIFYLPAYSPHLNKIETAWRQVKYRWIKPQDYQSLETLKLALENIWKQFGEQYKVNFKKKQK